LGKPVLAGFGIGQRGYALSAPTSAGQPVPPSPVGGAVVADEELALDREAVDPAVVDPPLVPDAPPVDPPPVLAPPVLPLPPPLVDARLPDTPVDPPVPVLSPPPRVELGPPPGPVFDVPDPPHAAATAAANAMLTVRLWSMLLQGLGTAWSRQSKRRRRP
jgi:hypothetical protein